MSLRKQQLTSKVSLAIQALGHLHEDIKEATYQVLLFPVKKIGKSSFPGSISG
jgi:hypothetical protein